MYASYTQTAMTLSQTIGLLQVIIPRTGQDISYSCVQYTAVTHQMAYVGGTPGNSVSLVTVSLTLVCCDAGLQIADPPRSKHTGGSSQGSLGFAEDYMTSKANDISNGPWGPSHQCVRNFRNLAILPQTRGPTPEKTFTYQNKFDDLEECFEACPTHYIVHVKDTGRCYCWLEQNCKPKGSCASGSCQGSPFGVWESESGVVVYDQTACYQQVCDGDLRIQRSSGNDSDSSDEDDSSSNNAGPPTQEDSSESAAPRKSDDDSSDNSNPHRSPGSVCVREVTNTAILPRTRGPTTGKTNTYKKKFDSIDKCFQECPTHYIVHDKDTGRCYCWMEQDCKPKGFCAEGGCPGSSVGLLEKEDGVAIYDQTACYRSEGACNHDITEVRDSSDDSSESQDESSDERGSPKTYGEFSAPANP